MVKQKKFKEPYIERQTETQTEKDGMEKDGLAQEAEISKQQLCQQWVQVKTLC